jgi:hypothetical protein
MAPKIEKGTAKKGGKLNPLLQGGAARGMGERWNHEADNVGTALLGRLASVRVTKFKDGKEGSALVFAPAVVVSEKGEITCHRQIETLLSASLATRINPAVDIGVVFGIEYTGTEPSATRGRAPFKTFEVVEQEPAILAKLLSDEGEKELAALVERAQ